jgi:hypothetical protein
MSDKVKRTGSNTHMATARGYAINSAGAGELVEPEDIVPADVPVSDEWMRPLSKHDARLQDAVREGQDPIKRDVDYTQLTLAALQALAAERGINVEGLKKDDLITAIKAADDPTR